MEPSNRLTAFALVALCALVTNSLAKKSDQEIFDEIRKIDTCSVQATFSFVQTEYNPPRTPADFERMCKTHSDGIKCLKEKSKGTEALIRRGALAMASTRQRQHKKLCSSPSSDQAKKFLAASKCAVENKLEQLKQIDLVFRKTVAAIVQRNYNDSSAELKQLCCVLHNFKQGVIEIPRESCPQHRAALEELASSIVTDDVTIVCDEEEKLSITCPKLEKLPIDRIQLDKTPPPAVLALYAFATLGEPSDQPMKFD